MGTMLRLIDGVLYEGRPADEFELSIHQLGDGHAEATVRRCTWWEELRPATPDELELWDRHREETADERREANRKRAARRATTTVRRLVKVAGMDSLLTLTYRSLQLDLALCKKHLKEFIRRMRRLIPGWQYVAAFERQERGAWHVHLAIHKLPMNLPASNGVKVKSYNIVRAVWRSVVGADNGNVDESRRRKFSGHTTAKIAAYISKYMLKAFADGDDWKNRYSSGGLSSPPPPTRMRGSNMLELITEAFKQVAMRSCEVWTHCRKGWIDAGFHGPACEPHPEHAPDGRAWRDCGFHGPVESFFLSTGPVSRHTKEVAHV